MELNPAAWALLIAVAAGCLGLVMIVLMRLRSGQKGRGRVRQAKGLIEITCSVCDRNLAFNRTEIAPLSPEERGLAVRSAPQVVGRPLGEYVCPYCEASHCFILERSKPEWIGVNLYAPQASAGKCQECGVMLRKPSWTPGAYDGKVMEAPQIEPAYGLKCSRCGAVACAACCIRMTRNQTSGEGYICPRCSRRGMNSFYIPTHG